MVMLYYNGIVIVMCYIGIVTKWHSTVVVQWHYYVACFNAIIVISNHKCIVIVIYCNGIVIVIYCNGIVMVIYCRIFIVR